MNSALKDSTALQRENRTFILKYSNTGYKTTVARKEAKTQMCRGRRDASVGAGNPDEMAVMIHSKISTF